jgi:hypothetical protein
MQRRQYASLINVVLIAGTVVGILHPAYTSSDTSLTQILLSLFHPEWSQTFLMRWVLVLAFSAGVYVFAIRYIYRNIPITIISTDLTVTFGPDGSATLSRNQLLRANQPNVTAYFSRHGPSAPNGSVPMDRIRADAFCRDWDCANEVELRQIGQTVELLHIFDSGLPFRWYMPLIPAWILNRDPARLFPWVGRYIVRRSDEVHYQNEFGGPQPIMEFTQAGRYQHFNLTIRIHFLEVPADFKVRGIKNNGVLKLQYENPKNHNGLVRTIHVPRMATGAIRITWRN